MAPPLAGKPPFATDLPDSYYEQPDPTPQRRYRQPAPPNPNNRTSAYDTYDDYLTDDEPASRRQSGTGALGKGFLDGSSDDEDDEDISEPQPRQKSPPPSPKHLDPQTSSKHTLLAAAAGVGKQTASPSLPQQIAAPKPGYVAPIASFQYARSSTDSSQPESPRKAEPPSPTKPQHNLANPFENPQQQRQPPPPPQGQTRQLEHPTNPFAAPRQNPFEPPRQGSFESVRQNPFEPPRQNPAGPFQHPTQRQPHPNPYHPQQHQPPPPQQRINPFLPQPHQQQSRQPQPQYPHAPQPRQPQPQYPHAPQMRQHIPHYGSSTPIPSTPHPLQPPVTPITPVFLRPMKERDIKFADQEPIMRASKEDTVLPSRGQKGDDFWRRFSMVAHEEAAPGGKKESNWLSKTQSGANRMSRWVWLVGVFLIIVVGGAVGLGWWVSHNDTQVNHQPGVLGGSAGETAGPLTTSKSVTSGSSRGVSPTHTVARRIFVEARATDVPFL